MCDEITVGPCEMHQCAPLCCRELRYICMVGQLINPVDRSEMEVKIIIVVEAMAQQHHHQRAGVCACYAFITHVMHVAQ